MRVALMALTTEAMGTIQQWDLLLTIKLGYEGRLGTERFFSSVLISAMVLFYGFVLWSHLDNKTVLYIRLALGLLSVFLIVKV